MQVDPMKPTLKAPGIKLLKLECDEPLSEFAFKFNLRRYSEEGGDVDLRDKQDDHDAYEAFGRGLHSSTFQLNVSAFLLERGCI